MFDIGWQELLLIGVVALIVVGPKDLPHVLRAVARFTQKARAMSREFQNGLAELAREAELDELRRKMNSAREDFGKDMREAVDPTGKLSADFDPEEFARKLKADVEGGPPRGPAAAAAGAFDVQRPPPAPGHAADTHAEDDSGGPPYAWVDEEPAPAPYPEGEDPHVKRASPLQHSDLEHRPPPPAPAEAPPAAPSEAPATSRS